MDVPTPHLNTRIHINEYMLNLWLFIFFLILEIKRGKLLALILIQKILKEVKAVCGILKGRILICSLYIH